jgi:hypothetical protein
VVRVVGVVASAALAVVLSSAVLRAELLSPNSGHADLGSALMLRLFGEISDSNASFAAAFGDRASESPLREMALHVGSSPSKVAYNGSAPSFTPAQVALHDLSANDVSYLAQAANAGLLRSDAHFAAPATPSTTGTAPAAASALLTAAYQPVVPWPNISPAPGTLAFGAPLTPSTDSGDRNLQLGRVGFEGHVAGASTQTPQLSLDDTAYNAGADFDVHAGKRNLRVNLSSAYERLVRSDGSNFTASTLDSNTWHLPQPGAPVVVPNYADLNRLSLGAGLAVPVVHGLTLNLNYDAQRLYGGYGLPGLVNLDSVSNTYGGKLSFDIPRTTGTLSISAYQDRFADGLLPLNGTTQTREDVNFTVKF